MIYSIQIARGIAALLIVIFHISGTIALEKYFDEKIFSSIFSFGYIGVELFFVLSGFIIYYVHERDLSKPRQLISYLKKRIVRVYPVYWIIFSGVFVLAYLTPLRDTLPSDLLVIIKSLLLLPQDKEIIGGTGAPVLIVAWSLQYEIVFYLLFAILIINRMAIYPLIICFIFIYLYSDEFFLFNFLTNEYFLLFLMGVFIAFLVRIEIANRYNKLLVLLSLLALILLIILQQLEIYKIGNNIVSYGLVFSFLILGVVGVEENGLDFKKYKFLNLLGDISYSMYLIHFPLISIIMKIFVFIGLTNYTYLGSVVAFFVTLLITVIVSVFFHKLIEKPLIKFFNRKFK